MKGEFDGNKSILVQRRNHKMLSFITETPRKKKGSLLVEFSNYDRTKDSDHTHPDYDTIEKNLD